MYSKALEVACDASIRTVNGKTYGCAGAVCMNDSHTLCQVIPNTTNNRSELIAIYLAVRMAHRKLLENPGKYSSVIIYSDSKNSVKGLRDWIKDWVKNQHNGILYTSNGSRVSNQDIIKMILNYMASNNLQFYLMHCKAHCSSQEDYDNAYRVFADNKILFPKHKIISISKYNNLIDSLTSDILNRLSEEELEEHENNKTYDNSTIISAGYSIPVNYNALFI